LFNKPVYRDAVAFVAGVATVAAFPPFNLAWLTIFTFAILLWLIHSVSARQAMRHGFAFGLGLFGFGISWVHISLHEYGGTWLPLSVFLTFLLAVYMSFYPALFAYLMVRLQSFKNPYLLVLSAPAIWTLSEWIRGTLFSGFPWLNLGYSQVDTWLVGFAPVFGVYGVSFIVVTLAASIYVFFKYSFCTRWLSLGLLVILLSQGYLLEKEQWVEPYGEPIKASLLQGNVAQLDKFLPEVRPVVMAMYRDMTLNNLESDLIVWPETAIPDFYHTVAGDYIADIKKQIQGSDTDLLIGVPMKQISSEDGRPEYYNSVVTVADSFEIYHKRHLVPLGEYVPMASLLRMLGGIFNVPLSSFSSGGVQPPLNVAGQRAALSVCYEIVFGEELIESVAESTMLVNVSNDGWFGDSLAPHQHFGMARMRIRETARPMLRATNTGITAFIDHRAKVTALAPMFEQHVLTGQLQPVTGVTPYVRHGNKSILALSLALLLLAVAMSYRWRAKL